MTSLWGDTRRVAREATRDFFKPLLRLVGTYRRGKRERALYRRHLFSRYKFRGAWVTWCLGTNLRWVRVGRFQLNYVRPNDDQ